MDKVSKYLTLQSRNVSQEFCSDTEELAILQASERVSRDTEKRPVIIYKAIKVVRPKESPFVVEDIPE